MAKSKVRATASIAVTKDDRGKALDELQASAGIDGASAKTWANAARAERRVVAAKSPKR